MATLRATPIARAASLGYPLGVVILLFAVGYAMFDALASGAGPVGGALGVALGIVVVGYWWYRGRNTYATLDADTLTVANGSTRRTIPWPEVGRIERRWKKFGGFTPRGQMLYVVQPASGDGGTFIYASKFASKRDRIAVFQALRDAGARFGVTLGDDVGSGVNFSRVGRDH